MKKYHFIVILVVYLLFFTGAAIITTQTDKGLPAEVNNYIYRLMPDKGSFMDQARRFLGPPILLMALVGYIGMFFFWNPARYIFLIAVLADITFSFLLPAQFITGFGGSLIGAQCALQGVILTLAFLGPARTYFERR